MAKRPQPPLGNDKKAVLLKKIQKFVEKGYIALVKGQIGSVIKYFAIPKGVINGVVQDWTTIFHAEANKLNDRLWTPSFSLPMINSLLQIVDKHTLMANWDMSEMFLNLNLHPDTLKFACIDIVPLELPKEDYPRQWMCWTRNLMGFKVLSYNLVRMYLVAEEIIWGDCHNRSNAFQ
jgi:hypothetical protein